jgi:hypothetical protein
MNETLRKDNMNTAPQLSSNRSVSLPLRSGGGEDTAAAVTGAPNPNRIMETKTVHCKPGPQKMQSATASYKTVPYREKVEAVSILIEEQSWLLGKIETLRADLHQINSRLEDVGDELQLRDLASDVNWNTTALKTIVIKKGDNSARVAASE